MAKTATTPAQMPPMQAASHAFLHPTHTYVPLLPTVHVVVHFVLLVAGPLSPRMKLPGWSDEWSNTAALWFLCTGASSGKLAPKLTSNATASRAFAE